MEATAVPETEEVSMSDLLVPEGTFKEVYNAPFPVAITLDGDLSEWAGVPTVTIPDTSVVAWDTTMTFAAASDGEYLYMMADVVVSASTDASMDPSSMARRISDVNLDFQRDSTSTAMRRSVAWVSSASRAVLTMGQPP